MAIGGALVHPQIIQAIQAAPFEGFEPLYFFGMPIIFINYSSSVIPIIFTAWVACKLEKRVDALIHSAVSTIFTPLICLVVVAPLTFLLLGPIAMWVSQLLVITSYSIHYTKLYDKPRND